MTSQAAQGRSRASAPATGTPAETVLRVSDLRMNYGSTEVLKGVDLTARRGEVIALLGPNGAGKTTTIEILEGFRRRSAGDVDVLGSDPDHGDEEWRSRLGVVLQSWRDHGAWRVRDLLHHFGRFYAPHSTPERVRPHETDALLDLVGLTEHATKRIKTLSGGQRRRLDVAIGVVGRPELLFLDEPTAGFDPKARRDFHDLVFRLADEEDTTILLTTHDLDEAEKLADRILLLAGGRIVADGSPAQLSSLIAQDSEVTWSVDGQRHVHSTDNPAKHVAELYAEHADAVTELRVTRPSLEDVYLAMVQRYESGDAERAAEEFTKETR
ncbi:MAG: ABC transporter ATP-binding protein [Nocardiopsis sp. BM-2018]|uniref:ABC-2 type transport system ATP-binding protein n=1 Tax=Nocardiopsis metallicus TaxID=179819 RepID=A0A840WVH4_9ACTN|nr:ABC-2 type transport system ATP-binding protein [Nocardiopsis metallicus]QRN81082.1 MAG: ABC transporter ATP-binding protein [Nocardiopsis sp. BM-2018]